MSILTVPCQKTAVHLLLKTAGGLFKCFYPQWANSLDYKVAYIDPIIDPAYPGDGKRRIYIFWHEYIQFLIHFRRNCGIAMLLSKHKDADIVEEIAYHFGFDVVRGSTNRGGFQAIREMSEKGKSVHLTITPDGPRGPRRVLAPGCVYLASKLQMPLVLLGVGYDRPWRFNSWDRFAVPRYGSRLRCVVSGDINIPDHLTREELEFYRKKVECHLNFLTEQAEDWAATGDSIEGESNLLPGPKYSILYHARRHYVQMLPVSLPTPASRPEI